MARSTAIIPAVAPLTNKDASSTHGSKLYNMYVHKDEAGVFHAVKRPGLDYDTGFNPTPGTYAGNNIGSGIGELISTAATAGSSMYQIWGKTVFLQTGAGTFTSKGLMNGAYTGKMYHAQLGDYIYVLTYDAVPVADSLSRFDVATALDDIDTFTYPASAGFPTKSGQRMAGGLQVLDQYLCCMTRTGRIYNSAAGDGTSWNDLDFTTAEMTLDDGVYLGKHHNHLVAFGSKSIEFFQNASLPTGSPFLRREDAALNVGAVGAEAVTEFEDLIFFVARGQSGDRYVAMMQNFQVRRISTTDLERRFWFGDGLGTANNFSSACLKIGGKLFYVITFIDNSDGSTKVTFAYDAEINQWYQWALTSGAAFEVVAASNGGSQYNQGNTLYVQTKNYVYAFDPQYKRDETTSGATDLITSRITTPTWTGEPHEIGKAKFLRQLKLLCDESTDASDTVAVEISTDDYATWVSLGSLPRNLLGKITNLGKVYRVAFRFTHAYNSDFRAQLVHLEYDTGV